MGPFDMEKVKVVSHDDMLLKRVGSSGEAYFGCGRRENGDKWWGTDIKISLNKACYGAFSTLPKP